MSANLRILYDDKILGATLSASPVLEATLPVENLKTLARSDVARSTSTASQDILGNFAASSSCSCFVLWRHNLTADATIRLRLYSAADQGGSLLYDSMAVPAMLADPFGALMGGYDPLGGAAMGDWQEMPRASALYFSPVEALSFKLTISDASNPDGYTQASRMMLGACLEPSQGADYGPELQWVDDSVQARSAAGTLRTPVQRGPVRQLTLNLSNLGLADAGTFAAIAGRLGRRGEMWVSLYPGWSVDSAYADLEYLHGFVCKFVGPHGSSHRLPVTWGDRLQVQEV